MRELEPVDILNSTEMDVFLGVPKMHLARVYVAASAFMYAHRCTGQDMGTAAAEYKVMQELLSRPIEL